jgi:hypothetical protein
MGFLLESQMFHGCREVECSAALAARIAIPFVRRASSDNSSQLARMTRERRYLSSGHASIARSAMIRMSCGVGGHRDQENGERLEHDSMKHLQPPVGAERASSFDSE